jgi:hypothetical protein
MKRLIIIAALIALIAFMASCEKEQHSEMIVNPIYPEDIQPLQGKWSFEGKYFYVSGENVTLNLFDIFECTTDSVPVPLPNYYLNDYLYDCGDTVIYHGDFWYLDSRGMTLHLQERGYWDFQYEFDGPDTLWLNRDTIPGDYRNILFLRD